MAKTIQFSAGASRQFRVEGLSVTTSLLGRSHEFAFESHAITLALPTESPPDAADWARKTKRTGWRADDPDNPETTIHQLFEVHLRTNIAKHLTIDERAFSEPYKSPHATPNQAQNLNRVADDYARLLAGAWEHWQAVVRWVAGHNSVGGAGSIVGADPYGGNTATIYRQSDSRKIWAQLVSIKLRAGSPLDPSRWQLLQDALSSGQSNPIWFDFISEAHKRFSSFDHRGAIASAAIAWETIVRSMFWLNVAQVENEAMRDMIDRTPAQAIIGKWSEIAGPRTSGKWETSSIHRLFDMRNRLMHSGQSREQPVEIGQLLNAATAFIGEADAVYSVRTHVPDWPARYRAIITNPRGSPMPLAKPTVEH